MVAHASYWTASRIANPGFIAVQSPIGHQGDRQHAYICRSIMACPSLCFLVTFLVCDQCVLSIVDVVVAVVAITGPLITSFEKFDVTARSASIQRDAAQLPPCIRLLMSTLFAVLLPSVCLALSGRTLPSRSSRECLRFNVAPEDNRTDQSVMYRRRAVWFRYLLHVRSHWDRGL